MVLWQSPDTPVMSCFHVSVRLRVCSSRALSHLCALFRVGAWCLDPGTCVLSFGFMSRFGHSCSTFCLIVCGLEFARPRALLSTCVFLCCTQFLFLSAACIHVISCAVWHAACVFHWLRVFMLSCLVWTCGLWVFSLAASPASHLVTCLLINFPQLLSLVTLLVCSLYNLLVFAVPCGFVVICWVVVRLVSSLASLFFPYGVVFVCFIYYLLIKSQFSSCIWDFALFSPPNLTLLVLLIMGLIH